jgi:ketosteroid isomerase-like protein
MGDSFDESEVRAAERALVTLLESADPMAWVDAYAADAVFVGPGGPPVEGRAALLAMARSMRPLSSVTITPERTIGDNRIACVYGHGGWVTGRPPEQCSAPIELRMVIVWRKEDDDVWRVAMEVLSE